MGFYGSLGTSQVVSARVTFAAWGACSGDAHLAADDIVPGRSTLMIGNLPLAVFATRSGAFAGSRSSRVVGGAGGWQKDIAAMSYANPSGVKLSTVLGDAARACGETLGTVAASSVGLQWVRARGPASGTLTATVGRGWWIDNAGVTQIGTRPTVPIKSDFTIEDHHEESGLFVIATEDPLAWAPGATFTSPLLVGARTVSSVTVDLREDGVLRLYVLEAS